MGIYNNDTIFGIKIYNFNDDDDDFANILFEKKYDEIMSNEQMSEAYLFYTKLINKNEIHFQYFTEYSSSYDDDEGTSFGWFVMSLELFLEKFGI